MYKTKSEPFFFVIRQGVVFVNLQRTSAKDPPQKSNLYSSVMLIFCLLKYLSFKLQIAIYYCIKFAKDSNLQDVTGCCCETFWIV